MRFWVLHLINALKFSPTPQSVAITFILINAPSSLYIAFTFLVRYKDFTLINSSGGIIQYTEKLLLLQ